MRLHSFLHGLNRIETCDQSFTPVEQVRGLTAKSCLHKPHGMISHGDIIAYHLAYGIAQASRMG